jgi:hypothetical protein
MQRIESCGWGVGEARLPMGAVSVQYGYSRGSLQIATTSILSRMVCLYSRCAIVFCYYTGKVALVEDMGPIPVHRVLQCRKA